MNPLTHQDPTLAASAAAPRSPLPGTKMPANNGEPRHGLDRHRTASYRLSCISEHQKENTRSSEDEYFSSSLRRHQQVNRKSQSSGDGSTVSPFQLDLEQIQGVCGQETNHHHEHHLVLSPRCCATPAEFLEHSEQPHKTLATKPPGLASPETFEVQWHIIRWIDAPRNVYIQGHRCNISVTGFDGPRSSTSGTSPLHSPNDASNPPLGPLSLSSCLPCKSRKLKSDTSGSVDWEKSWSEKKPRNRDDVSESSDLGPLAQKHPIDSRSIEVENNNSSPLKCEEQGTQSQFRNAQECALKSCPELYRRSFSAVRSSISNFTPDTVSGLRSPNYTQFDSSRHQHRHRLQDAVSKRFYFLRDRLRRGRSSSMFSVRPEFPPPPTGKVRRYRSRNSNEIWPSSEESPIFNTPESNKSPVQLLGQNTALLAVSGLRIATVELDRLTNNSRSAKSSLELARIPSATDSARSESGSSVAETTPAAPANSLSSLSTPVGLANMISRPPQRPGLRSRRQHSRLSEVTTPEEINSSTQTTDNGVNSPQLLYFTREPLQDTSPCFEAESCESLMYSPLAIQRPCLSHNRSNGEPSHDSVSAVTESPLDQDDSSKVALGLGNILPEGTCSRDGTTEPRFDERNIDDEYETREHILDRRPLIIRPSLMYFRSEPNYRRILSIGIERSNIDTEDTACGADVSERLNYVESRTAEEEFMSKSCHPDTWSPKQGEPGDSEPFCPSTCVYSSQCNHQRKP
ncbi:hypothetical protein F5Y12DRAFT_788291 [Xylaria sp. FL1777]|nr:hypothetical protein F5Y12DRAFT_788291 [Xylaria sp. FL1777]